MRQAYYKAGGAFARCYVRSSEDCAQAEACKQRGECHLYDGINPGVCVALTDLDCRQSSECAQHGKCSLGELGRCVMETSGCQRTDGCKRAGTCVFERPAVAVSRVSSTARTLVGKRARARCETAWNEWCYPIAGGDGCYDGRTECGQLCWERGDCKRIDGTCQPGDESSCEPSLACIVLGQCSLTGRPAVMCGRRLRAEPRMQGVRALHGQRHSVCGRERALAEAGLPEWQPPPVLR